MKKIYELFCKICDVPKLVLRLWLSLWIVLFIVTFMKVFFNELYPIVVENEKVLYVFSIIENIEILKNIIYCSFYLLNSYLLFTIGIRRTRVKWKYLLPLTLVFIISYYFKTYSYQAIGTIIEISFGIILPIILNIKNKLFGKNIWNIIYPIVTNIVVSLWQLNMLFIRDIDKIMETSTTFQLVLQIDYYIFLVITWIGVNYFMGNLGWWFWSKDVTKIKAELQKEEAKANPNEKKIKQLKERIVELEKE